MSTELITAGPAEGLAGLLGLPVPDLERSGVPLLWHWVYLLERPAQADLGPDGHPLTGIPAPPGPGRRRMFAGGRARRLRPLRIASTPSGRAACCRRSTNRAVRAR